MDNGIKEEINAQLETLDENTIGGLWGESIEVLKNKLLIEPKDLVPSINLSWSQLIRAINYYTNEKVVSWKSKAIEIFKQSAKYL